MVRPTTETLSATVRNELRRTVAIQILAYVFTKSSMKKADMERIMFECYHGNKGKDIASHVSMIARGESGYSELYDKVGVHITDSGTPSCAASATSSTSSGTGGEKLVLKSALIRSDERIMAGREINVQVLEKSSFKANSALTPGRTLLASANEAWRTIKKAIAIVKPRINSDGSPKDSGLSPEDIQEFVLEKMYRLLKNIGDNTGKSLGDGTDDDANK